MFLPSRKILNKTCEFVDFSNPTHRNPQVKIRISTYLLCYAVVISWDNKKKEKKMKKLLFALSVVTLMSINVYSQGKILSKEEANELFGTVLVSKEMPASSLKAFVGQSSKVIMFNIINNDVYILDDSRKVLLPSGFSVSSSEVFHVYSTLIVQELLDNGNTPVTYIEQRKEVLTITNGDLTLEYALICPPFCN